MVKTFRLPNGITCVTESRPGSGKVSMQVRIKAGAVDEAAAENGLTALVQEACNGGTKTLSRAALAEAIESKGGYFFGDTGRGATSFNATTLTRHAGDTFAVLADMILNPAFAEDEIALTKAQIAQALEQQGESPAGEAGRKFFEAAFAGQGLAQNPLGRKELLDTFTPQQVKRRHAELLAKPENIVISFAGDIDAAAAEKLVEQQFGNLAVFAAPPPARAPQKFTQGDIRVATDNDQLNLHLGFPAPAKNSPDRLAAALLEEYLSGGMSSPLFQEVREKRSLVYGIGASYSPLEDGGIFRVSAGAGKGNAGELISVTLDVMGGVIKNGVSDADLARCRERIIRSLKGSLEPAEEACGYNAEQLMAYGRPASAAELAAQLESVTSDDLRRVCAGLLQEGKYAFAGVGPLDSMPAEAEIKAQMQKQLQGAALPAAATKASAKPTFSATAQKEQAAKEPRLTTLKNGMRVLTVERPGNLACGAWVGVGSDNETISRADDPKLRDPDAALNGSTHMLEHLPFKGTRSYGPGTIDRIIEGELGGDLNAYTTKDKTTYHFYNLEPAALDKVIDICGEMVFEAALDNAEFDGKVVDGVKQKGERDVVIEELKRSNDNLSNLSYHLLDEAAYHDQTHGWPVIGSEDMLRAMSVEQLRAFRDRYYVPSNVIFCATGPVKHDDFVKLIESKYGHMPAGEEAALPVPVYKGGTAYAEHKNASLCRVKIMAEGAPDGSPERLAFQALGQLLGGGASSRLTQKIVVEQQLTGGVFAGADGYRNTGAFVVGASVEPKNVKAFAASAYAEMRRLADTLTPEELDKAKAGLEMELLMAIETNGDAADAYACGVQASGKATTPAELSAQIKNLTVEDIRRVLKKVLACNPTFTAVVPPGTDARLLPRHAEVVSYRDGKGPPKSAPVPKAA